MIAKASNIKQKLLDIKHGKIKEGLKIGVPEIDEYIRWKYGSFDVFIGHANVGKTTVVCYLLTLWAEIHKLKFLVWSSENTSESIVRKILEFKMGEPIHTASEQKISKGLEWVDKHFKIIDVQEIYTYKKVLEEATQIKEVWDYDGLLIDPYNSLAKDNQLMRSLGAHEYDYFVASEFRLWAQKYNVTLMLNAHGVTEALRRTYPKGHEYENLPQPLGMASVEGGSKWGNRCNQMYCIHRFTSHEKEWMYSHIHVLKVKETETGGRCTPFEQPIKLRMARNNVGFEFLGKDLLHSKRTEIEELEF